MPSRLNRKYLYENLVTGEVQDQLPDETDEEDEADEVGKRSLLKITLAEFNNLKYIFSSSTTATTTITTTATSYSCRGSAATSSSSIASTTAAATTPESSFKRLSSWCITGPGYGTLRWRQQWRWKWQRVYNI